MNMIYFPLINIRFSVYHEKDAVVGVYVLYLCKEMFRSTTVDRPVKKCEYLFVEIINTNLKILL